MAFDDYSRQFSFVSSWPARGEEPDAIGDRHRRFLDTLGEIDETLRPWWIGKKRYVPYHLVRDGLAALIGDDVKIGEDGLVERKAGYTILGVCSHPRQGYSLIGHAGGVYETPASNELLLNTQGEAAVDTTILTYSVMKAIALTFIACWEPASCDVKSTRFDRELRQPVLFRWMAYVPPAQVAHVDLIGVPFSERTPNDGLLLSATEQAFDEGNPVHRASARRIEAVTAALPNG